MLAAPSFSFNFSIHCLKFRFSPSKSFGKLFAMALLQGCLDSLFQLHKVYPIAIKFTSYLSAIWVIPNPKFSGSSNFAWYTSKLFLLCLITFSAGRHCWVITNWNNNTDFEESSFTTVVNCHRLGSLHIVRESHK